MIARLGNAQLFHHDTSLHTDPCKCRSRQVSSMWETSILALESSSRAYQPMERATMVIRHPLSSTTCVRLQGSQRQ